MDDVIEPARQLRDIGVEVFSIGVENALRWVNIALCVLRMTEYRTFRSELEDIASDPDIDHVFSVENFDRIDEVKDKLLSDVCKSVRKYIKWLLNVDLQTQLRTGRCRNKPFVIV